MESLTTPKAKRVLSPDVEPSLHTTAKKEKLDSEDPGKLQTELMSSDQVVQKGTVEAEKPVEEKTFDMAYASTGKMSLLETTDMTQTCLSEQQVGIQCYINTHLPAFSAILKHRFTDFLVYEVDSSGEVVRLKDISDPRGLGDEPPPTPKTVDNTPAQTPQQNVRSFHWAVKTSTQLPCLNFCTWTQEWPNHADEKLVGTIGAPLLADLKLFIAHGPPKSNRANKRSKTSGHNGKDRRGRDIHATGVPAAATTTAVITDTPVEADESLVRQPPLEDELLEPSTGVETDKISSLPLKESHPAFLVTDVSSSTQVLQAQLSLFLILQQHIG